MYANRIMSANVTVFLLHFTCTGYMHYGVFLPAYVVEDFIMYFICYS